MTNKILMVGVLDVPSSTNVFMAKGFEQLGYEVEAYNYRTVANKIGTFKMWDNFKRFLIGRDYHLIVFCKTNAMHPELLSDAREIAPTWYWFMDPIGTAQAVMAQEYAKYATYASATSSEVVNTFKAVNENSFHIIEGYDPEIYFYEDLEKKYDVTFIGNATGKRANDIIDIKKATGKRIHICGANWPLMGDTSVFNENERRVINQSKIILNLSHDGVTFSDRIVKSLACGALVLSQYSNDLSEIFPGWVALYKTTQDAKELIELFLEQEGKAIHMQREIAEKVKNRCSWKAVCQQILEKVK